MKFIEMKNAALVDKYGFRRHIFISLGLQFCFCILTFITLRSKVAFINIEPQFLYTLSSL